MRLGLASVLTISALTIAGSPRAAFGQAAAIALSLGLTASPTEIQAGGTVSVVVQLRNYKGEAVAASEPVTATLHSALGGDATLTFERGQKSARTQIRFERSGVATLVVSAPGMTSGTSIIVVKNTAQAAAARTPPRAAEPPAGGGPVPPTTEGAPIARGARNTPAPAAAGGAAPPGVALAVDVLPQHVHPANAMWKALVLVTAIDEARQPIAVRVDTPVHLATDIGLVTPATTQIAAGRARTSEPIQLTSDRPGTGALWAWTDTGRLTTAAVEYHEAVPTQLIVRGLPTRTVNDGRTAIHVTVFLQDETSATASADDTIAVKLTSSVGTPNPSTLSIPKGTFFAESILTSPTAGRAEITATAPRLKAGSAEVEFVFPVLLVVLAGTGGLVGSVVRSSRQIFTGAWMWHLFGSVAIGIVLGLLFFLLALFGLVASIPKLALPLAQIPTTNDLGALVLGFFGGYYARAWLPDPSTAAKPDAPDAH